MSRWQPAPMSSTALALNRAPRAVWPRAWGDLCLAKARKAERAVASFVRVERRRWRALVRCASRAPIWNSSSKDASANAMRRGTTLPRRWSSRRQLRMSSRWSADRPVSWGPCSNRCWRTPRASATLSSGICISTRETHFASLRCTARHPRMPRLANTIHLFDRLGLGPWSCCHHEAAGSHRRHQDDAVLHRAGSIFGSWRRPRRVSDDSCRADA